MMKTRVSVIVAMAALAVLVLPTLGSANLVVEGGFENNNLAPLASIVGPPYTPAIWGWENATNVNTGGSGITPRTGRWMHEMKPAGNYTQTMQFIDITANPVLHASAWFNSDAQAANASLLLAYYAGINSWNTAISIDSHSLILDNLPGTWQTIDFVSTRPTGATWVGIQVAYLDSSIMDATGATRSGYVDDVSLEDSKVPEPGSMLALGSGILGLGGMFLRRRKS